MFKKQRLIFTSFQRGWRLDLIAFASVSTSIFLFIHTQTLHAKINAIQENNSNNLNINHNGLSQPQTQSGRNKDPEYVDRTIQPGKTYLQFTLPDRQYSAILLNNTRHIEKPTLFFNRVPKVGSQTLMDLISKLSTRNGFEFHRDGTQKVETIKLSFYEESRLTTMIDMFNPPSAYVKHTCFSNFTKHGYPMPIYMNIVRDPVERIISWFYYIRAPWYIIERKQAFPELPLPHPKWLKKDFDSCVLDGDRECQFLEGEYHDGVGDHRRQAMFFCGHEEECVAFNSPYALQKAKANVEHHYAVVGVLEELELSLQVLEKYIPLFFDGALEVYRAHATPHVNKNIYKPPVSLAVKELLRKNFTREIEFYEFCKQKLHAQYAALIQNKLLP